MDEDDRSIVGLVGDGVLDADLAALLWLLVERRVPAVVAGSADGERRHVLSALIALLDPGTRRIGDLHASEQGTRVCLVLPELPGERAMRAIVGAVARGVGLLATTEGERLEEILDRLRGPSVGLSDDEVSYLGVVLIAAEVERPDGVTALRVVAAHYLRPVARDAGGHIQRLAPAVLATWDERDDTFSHFAWGVAGDLAGRVGMKAGDFEAEHRRRADYVAGLARGGITGADAVRSALASYRAAGAGGSPGHRQ